MLNFLTSQSSDLNLARGFSSEKTRVKKNFFC
uniref:Uncharacterized protein n=1 Tax=Siphoviridae sp. ctn8e14 TaxID=2827936 RepID=A0A8S5T5C3_9CAUD|nr:MAG TPA: hypothetical protein [Siphoviridae sp. ctn8e14]